MDQHNEIPKLPDRVVSDRALHHWSKANIPGFLAVLDRTTFDRTYSVMKPGQSVIINLDPNYKHGGTHWVALRVSSEAPLVYYKDSYGAPCPINIIRAVKDSGRGLIYGNRILQHLTEANCGKRSAYFLRNLAKAAELKNEIDYFECTETS
jgi:hypothetical protein